MVEKCDGRHAKEPKLKCDENEILTPVIVKLGRWPIKRPKATLV